MSDNAGPTASENVTSICCNEDTYPQAKELDAAGNRELAQNVTNRTISYQ